MKLKKVMITVLAATMITTIFTGCGKSKGGKFDKSGDITIVSREEGSGTRGAFVELFGVEQKDESGNKVDRTTVDANVTNSTSVMMTTVSEDPNGIGYISLGSLNDTVKAVKIDGVEASVKTIKDGSYKISRPFNIVTKDGLSDLAKDFISYIMSKDGQKVIEDNGYISASDAAAYSGNKPSGKITIAGSSSVTPVMEKLKEAYLKVNTSADIEIQESDSTTGVTSTIEGICDIGMASRDLKDSETAKGVKGTVIAMDGIAVIVNKDNPTENFSKDQVMNIYTGKTTVWSDVEE